MILFIDCFGIFVLIVNMIIFIMIGKEMYFCLSFDYWKIFFKVGMFFFSKCLVLGVSKKCIGVMSIIKDCFVNKILILFFYGYIV